MRKNYSGSDLSRESKSQLNSYIKKITKILSDKGCVNLDFRYGFHSISGFFTSKSGQPYYIGSTDTRMGLNLYFRTVKDYKDYQGGYNNHVTLEVLRDVNFK